EALNVPLSSFPSAESAPSKPGVPGIVDTVNCTFGCDTASLSISMSEMPISGMLNAPTHAPLEFFVRSTTTTIDACPPGIVMGPWKRPDNEGVDCPHMELLNRVNKPTAENREKDFMRFAGTDALPSL